jgi:tetratricopeptide (TPR) repeat protein
LAQAALPKYPARYLAVSKVSLTGQHLTMAQIPVVNGVFVGKMNIPQLKIAGRRSGSGMEKLDIAAIKKFESSCMSDSGDTVSTGLEVEEMPLALRRVDDYIDAFFCFDGEVDETAQNRADGRYKLGDAFLNQVHDVDDAIEEFYGALDMHPRHADALCGLGAALNEQGYEEGAIDILKCALEVAPEHASAHLFLGVALYRIGDLWNAESSFRSVMNFTVEDSDPYAQAKKRLDRIEAKKAAAA